LTCKCSRLCSLRVAQAYYEGRVATQADVDAAVAHYHAKLVPASAMDRGTWLGRVGCPCPVLACCYRATHPPRTWPYAAPPTAEAQRVYGDYERNHQRELHRFRTSEAPRRRYLLGVCSCLRQGAGRRGAFFCTEGMGQCCSHKRGDPAPPLEKGSVRELSLERETAAEVVRAIMGPAPEGLRFAKPAVEVEAAVEMAVGPVATAQPSAEP
jgi:hypothetical protein